MKILITGGTGFIGRAVCEALGREGHELIVVTRDPNHARTLVPAPHQSLKWDFSESLTSKDLPLIQNIDAVINLAGEPILGKRWNSELKQQLYDSRVKHTQNLISLLRSHGNPFPKIWINASAIGFYGNRGNEILAESSQPGTDFLAHLCQDWEKTLFDQDMKDTRQVALRIGIVLGQGGGALEEMLYPFSLGLGGPLGDGSQWMSWIHLEDLVQIVLECLHHEKWVGPINCCAPHPVTNREFTESLAKALNTIGKLSVPKLALKAAFGEGACALLSSQRVTPQKLINQGFPFKYPNLESALSSTVGEGYPQGLSEFKKKCWLPLPIEEVFKFFSEANNLEKITPPWLGFHILSQSSEEIRQGTTIDYRLKLHGIPIRWRTEISSWNPPNEFTDNQTKGPYRVWKHTHRFSELGNGTLMEDRVLYQVPMGYLGKLVAGKYVSKDVSQIFSYRNKQIYKLLFQANGRGSK